MNPDDFDGIQSERIEEIREYARARDHTALRHVEELIAEIERLTEILRGLFGV